MSDLEKTTVRYWFESSEDTARRSSIRQTGPFAFSPAEVRAVIWMELMSALFTAAVGPVRLPSRLLCFVFRGGSLCRLAWQRGGGSCSDERLEVS